jgi:hypothetical protein
LLTFCLGWPWTLILSLPNSQFISYNYLWIYIMFHSVGHLRCITISIHIKVTCSDMDKIERLTKRKINTHVCTSQMVLYNFYRQQ